MSGTWLLDAWPRAGWPSWPTSYYSLAVLSRQGPWVSSNLYRNAVELAELMVGLGVGRVRQRYIHHLHSVSVPLPTFQGVPVSWTCQIALSNYCTCIISKTEFPETHGLSFLSAVPHSTSPEPGAGSAVSITADWKPAGWGQVSLPHTYLYPVLPLSVVTTTLNAHLFPGVWGGHALGSHVPAASHPVSNVASSLTTWAVVHH